MTGPGSISRGNARTPLPRRHFSPSPCRLRPIHRVSPPPPPHLIVPLKKMCRKACPLTWRRCRRHTRDIDKSWSRVEAREMNGFVGAFFVQDNPAPARFFVDPKFFSCTPPQLPPHVGAIRNCIPRCPSHGGRH